MTISTLQLISQCSTSKDDLTNAPCHGENQICAYAKTKARDQLISIFVFAVWIVQYLFFLNPIFQAFSPLL